MAQQAAAIEYLDTIIAAKLDAEHMEQEIRARMAHMAPWLQQAYQKMLATDPPKSMMGWAIEVLCAREAMRDYPRD